MRWICVYLTIAALLAIAGCQPSATPVPAASHEAAVSSQPTTSLGNEPGPVLPSSRAPATASDDAAEEWQCGEILLEAKLDGMVMHLHFSGRTLALAHGESLTGARYADTTGNEFMRQGDGAMLILHGDEARTCSRSPRAGGADGVAVAWRSSMGPAAMA